ncbi:MAG TPA: hypothetical protein VGR28_06660 [Candidatus Thermoplasmatota archaeon]|jgi:hypothetical protein|nr:hypothetical protein [Candidatus Thermoplasmatota archaeon]
MDANHAFDGKRQNGTRCSCGHARGDHVERYEKNQPLKNVCRVCAE